MARLYELTSDGKIVPGIVNRDYTLTLGEPFINNPAPVLTFSREFPRSRIEEADFQDGCFYPQQYQESRVIILMRDQFASEGIGPWDLFHPDDPICEEPHTMNQACHKCQEKGNLNKNKCGHICQFCFGKMKVKARRIHLHDVDIIARHYHKKYTRRSDVRGGMEALIYLSPGESVLIIRYSRTWYRHMHRLLEFDVEGRLRLTYFNDRDLAQPQSVWL